MSGLAIGARRLKTGAGWRSNPLRSRWAGFSCQGGPDSSSIGAAKPQEAFCMVRHLPSCACGTPIDKLSRPPAIGAREAISKPALDPPPAIRAVRIFVGFAQLDHREKLAMHWKKQLFARKDLEMLLAEAAGEHRLHRVLGPVTLTSLGVGCIIGAGIFVMTGRAAAFNAGPSVTLSFAIAGLGLRVAALCYAEFAAMAPVAGSAYTYAYTTLGEIFAWFIGWDLILEYSMGCATVAAAWTHYFNELLLALGLPVVPIRLSNDPYTLTHGVWGILNLPAVCVVLAVTVVLVLGIRESTRTNATLVLAKLAVVAFVVVVGWNYVDTSRWTTIPVSQRHLPQEKAIPELVKNYLDKEGDFSQRHAAQLEKQLIANCRIDWEKREMEQLRRRGTLTAAQAAARMAELQNDLPKTEADRRVVEKLSPQVIASGEAEKASSWGLLGLIGLNQWLVPLDDATRTPFAPYGLSGIMLGASIVFFAFIGFDSISTHAEEACRPQRDLPIGILASLAICTVLYIIVAAVVTGMVPYPQIDVGAPIASAFAQQPGAGKSIALRSSTALVAAGGLAGMTSVLLVLFLSQARVFMAMARDGLLPKIFSTVHPRFRTPHLATMVTGAAICLAAALTPIKMLQEMVNIGTLMAFALVCAAVLMLRVQRPEAHRPFRCPWIYVVAPAGVVVNLTLTLFLPWTTWLRLAVWLVLGLIIYFLYSRRHSHLSTHLLHEIQMPREEETGTAFDTAVVE